MRVFLAACLTAAVFATVALFALDTTQQSTAVAFTTEGARIDPGWGERTIR